MTLAAALCALATLCVLGVSPGRAQAANLLVLNGDTETLSGSAQFGMVYIDGGLQLTGDTTITAGSIYIGPDAYVDSCFVIGSGDTCTNGRSLTLDSTGALTVAVPLDLTGQSGSSGTGGNLTLSGDPVSVAGDIDTAGFGGGASGQVSIGSAGALAVDGIYAPGAGVTLSAAGSIDVGDGIQTQGTSKVGTSGPTQVQSGGAVKIGSSGGDVRVEGGINTTGLNAPAAGALGGGNGGAVSISGANVRSDGISTSGGDSAAAGPGASGPVTINADGTLAVLGSVNANGGSGSGGSGAPGAKVALTAAGALSAGSVQAQGGQGTAGGTITLGGSQVTTGDLDAQGGNGTNASPTGGNGGAITVTAPGGASLGSLLAYGGGTPGGAAPGSGGTASVVSTGGSITVSSVQTQGGYQSSGAGAPGGPIALEAGDNLSVGETLNASGSDANGSASPPAAGGDAGSLTLSADAGTLALGGNAMAQGGTGEDPLSSGALGGAGGNGGAVQIVAHAIGVLASLSAAGGAGGSYGNTQGPGGAGGSITAFTDGPLFNDEQLVSSDGGDGNPTGTAGNQEQNASPSGLTVDPNTGRWSFSSNSPAATQYRILMSVGGAAPATALATTATSGAQIAAAPLCAAVSLTAVAIDGAVGWISDASPAVGYTRQPSARQTCTDPPAVSTTATVHRTLRQLRRSRWLLALPVTIGGTGTLEVTLQAEGAAATSGSTHHARHARHSRHGHHNDRVVHGTRVIVLRAEAVKAGRRVLHLPLPAADRLARTYRVQLTTTAPDGGRRLTSTVTFEVAK